MARVRFVYRTGIRRAMFKDVRLLGSWDARGRWMDGAWAEFAMSAITWDDGQAGFVAELDLVPDPSGRHFRWGVRLDGFGGPEQWGIVTEMDNASSRESLCLLTLPTAMDGGDPGFALSAFEAGRRPFGATHWKAGPKTPNDSPRRVRMPWSGPNS